MRVHGRRRLRRGHAEHALRHVFPAGHAGRDGGQRARRAAARLGRHPCVRARPGGGDPDAAAHRGRLRQLGRLPGRLGRRAAHRQPVARLLHSVDRDRQRPDHARVARRRRVRGLADPVLRHRARAVRARRGRADRGRHGGADAAPQAGAFRARLGVRGARRRRLRGHSTVRACHPGQSHRRAGPAHDALRGRQAERPRCRGRGGSHPVPVRGQQLDQRQYPHRRGRAAHRGAARRPRRPGRHRRVPSPPPVRLPLGPPRLGPPGLGPPGLGPPGLGPPRLALPQPRSRPRPNRLDGTSSRS